jgi:hypothetical protein
MEKGMERDMVKGREEERAIHARKTKAAMELLCLV